MSRIEHVIAEVSAAREEATRKFAAEANMSVADFQRHFQVVLELAAGDDPSVSFRVEPIEDPKTVRARRLVPSVPVAGE
jgi:hypothetical protein